VTAPTATALTLLRDHGLRVPSRVMSNGIDTRTFSPGGVDRSLLHRYGLEDGTPVVLSVGRLSPEKRTDVILAAAARLRSRVQLVVAGSGQEEAALRAMAERLGLSGSVRFPGFVPAADLPGLYRLADVFAIASEAELQSLTTMEAMASGLPVVAVDACALAELVVHERNGYLTRPGDAADMASRLDMLVSDHDLRSRMSAASLEIISGHDQDRWLAEWESLYGLLASARSGEL
jgi:glycosyltransferase involved in cell wall biosynthesis